MNPSVATVFEWEQYPYVIRSQNCFKNGVFSFTRTFLDMLGVIDPDQKMFSVSRDTFRTHQFVGVIRIEGFSIQILPKLFRKRFCDHKQVIARNLAVMLSFGSARFFPVGLTGLDEEDIDLLDAFIRLFAENLLHLISHVQARDYLEKQESLRFIQERIITKDYWNPARLHIIPCQYHAFSSDTLINRALKYCSTLMLRQTRNSMTASRLKQVLMILEPVDYAPVNLDQVRHIQFNRLNRKYEPFIQFCEFYLSNTTLALKASHIETFSFLVPMEKVFESFIASIISEFPRVLPSGITCKAQYHAGYLVKDHHGQGLFRMRPDLVLFSSKSVAVIDTKYKILSEDKKHTDVDQADVYQMYAYGAKTGGGRIVLLYPDDGVPIYLDWTMEYETGKNVDLLVRSVPLSVDLLKDRDKFIDHITHLLYEACRRELPLAGENHR